MNSSVEGGSYRASRRTRPAIRGRSWLSHSRRLRPLPTRQSAGSSARRLVHLYHYGRERSQTHPTPRSGPARGAARCGPPGRRGGGGRCGHAPARRRGGGAAARLDDLLVRVQGAPADGGARARRRARHRAPARVPPARPPTDADPPATRSGSSSPRFSARSRTRVRPAAAWLLATYALMLEAARRPGAARSRPCGGPTPTWTRSRRCSPRPARRTRGPTRSSCSRRPTACWSSSSRTGDASDLAPRLRRLADALVKA